jgi:hypothetical protein
MTMVCKGSTVPAELTGFRLFCIAFVLTFSGIMTNIAAYQWLHLYLDQRNDANRPATEEVSTPPRLAWDVRQIAHAQA